MGTYTVKLPSGEIWTPKFVTEISAEKCIGCGRCFKVCARDVLTLTGLNEDGEYIVVDADGDDDDEYEKKVMTLAHPENCVGCEACARICPRKSISNEATQV